MRKAARSRRSLAISKMRISAVLSTEPHAFQNPVTHPGFDDIEFLVVKRRRDNPNEEERRECARSRHDYRAGLSAGRKFSIAQISVVSSPLATAISVPAG